MCKLDKYEKFYSWIRLEYFVIKSYELKFIFSSECSSAVNGGDLGYFSKN